MNSRQSALAIARGTVNSQEVEPDEEFSFTIPGLDTPMSRVEILSKIDSLMESEK